MEVKLRFPDSIYSKEPSTWDKYFSVLQEMADRMAMSYHKYHADHPLMEVCPDEDIMAFTRQRMAMYDGVHASCDQNCRELPDTYEFKAVKLGDKRERHATVCFLAKAKLNTGNTENCVDAANGLVLERIFPGHYKAHFRSQSEKESPGVVMKER